MEITQVLLIGGAILGGLLTITLGVLFFVSRKSQKVMESLLMIMTRPERAKVADAIRVLNTMLADEINKIEQSFQTMRDTLNAQIATADELKKILTEQNEKLVSNADEATKKIATMSGRLDNTVTGLGQIVESQSWTDVENATDRFMTSVNGLLGRIDQTALDTTERTGQIQSQIDSWIDSGKTLAEHLGDEFNKNTEQMKTLAGESETMRGKLAELATSVAGGFNDVKSSASNYEDIMVRNDRLLDSHLDKLSEFSKQSKKQLTSQMNTLTNTANVVAGQVRLAESSIDKQTRRLTDAVETLMSTATSTENSVRGISTELATLTNRFDGEIKEFATGVVSELKTVSGVANATLENTKTAAGAFSESVRAMATGVRETLIEMNTAHTQLSGQSENLIKMSSETTAQLQPLSALIEKYYSALPDLSRGSVEASQTLEQIVGSLNEKLNQMKTTVAESTTAISDSAIKLEDLAGTSRQQMIDLMSDYAKAVNTMQTLNKQMMVARASAPMDAIKSAPMESFGHISSSDFLAQGDKMFEKLHELAMDLTRAAGAEIPDVVWKKYHSGDKTIFSKWLAKMLNAADKKRIKEMLKGDAVFRSQATQFVRSFDKILARAQQTDNADKVSATLIKTDSGQIYIALKSYV
jgi:methyl-accepting chemotaxis protein